MYRRILAGLSMLLFSIAGHAIPLGTAFTYQGELRVAGQPANGSYDFEIALVDSPTAGTVLDTLSQGDVAVTQGLFALTLDYTSVPFESSTQYYIELRVRDGASSGSYTTLLPRQPILATPFALRARTLDPGASVAGSLARPVHSLRDITLPGTPATVAGESSLTTGVDGLAITSVYDAANGDLQVMHCDTPDCSRQTFTTLDSAGIVGRGNSIVIASNGLPVISYIDSTNSRLKLARCADTKCTSATLSVVDPAVGSSLRSVVLQGFGNPGGVEIVYHDEAQGDLESASCQPGVGCTLTTLDSANNVGHALDAMRVGNTVVVAYRDETAGSLKLKVCSSLVSTCSGATALTVDAASAPVDIALTTPPDGRPLIAYVRGTELRSARCTTPDCTATVAGGLITTSVVGVAATLGNDGLPALLAQSNSPQSVRFLKCVDAACSATIPGITQTATSTDARPAMTLGTHGYPILSFRRDSSLAVIVCDSPECIFASRRR